MYALYNYTAVIDLHHTLIPFKVFISIAIGTSYSSDIDLFTYNVSNDSVIAVAIDTVSRVSGIEDFTFESLDTNHYDIIGGKGSDNF